MRGDIEILAYNLIQWLCGSLPWEKNLTDPSSVQKQKEAAFNDTQKFLKQCFNDSIPEAISQFVSLLAKMKFNDSPDYEKFKNTLIKGLKDLGKVPGGKLEFGGGKIGGKTMVTAKEVSVKVARIPVEKKVGKTTPVRPKKMTKKESNEVMPRRIGALKRLSSEANSMNDSMEILNNSCISGDDVMKNVLANIDPGADYEVQIKRKKRVVEKVATPDKKATKGAGTSAKRTGKVERKKLRKQSESDSEPEVKKI